MLEATLQRAVALHHQGQLARARILYEEILSSYPRHFDALHLLGVIAAVTGDHARAVDLIGRAVDIAPRHAIAHNNRALAYQELGRRDEALAGYERAAALDEKYAEPHFNRGNLFRHDGRWEDALRSYESAIARRYDYAEAHGNRGLVLAKLGLADEALASYERAIVIKPDYVEAHYNRGNILCQLQQWQAAFDSFEKAIAHKHDHAEAYVNRAFALKELGRMNDALASCHRAIVLKPDLATAYSNLGSALTAMGRVPDALSSYDRAIAIAPDAPSIHVNRGLTRLLAGDFAGGWADYEWRWRDTGSWVSKERRGFVQPLWLGETPLDGRTILLHSEQGNGDTIQFCRFAAAVASLGAQVILEVPATLVSLMQGLAGVRQVVAQGSPLPAFDCYCPLLSLPLALQTSLATIPAEVPYLRSDEGLRREWSSVFDHRSAPRVGLVWSSGFHAQQPELWSSNLRRNVPLETMAALSHVGVEYYSLQKGERAESELAELKARGWNGLTITDLTARIRDFADTAALIEHLDLVISVDTAVAHLSGALGKPVWLLNRFDSCWRWLLDRSDSPWYPTARVYRQTRLGDWEGVLRRVRADLATFCGNRAARTN